MGVRGLLLGTGHIAMSRAYGQRLDRLSRRGSGRDRERVYEHALESHICFDCIRGSKGSGQLDLCLAETDAEDHADDSEEGSQDVRSGPRSESALRDWGLCWRRCAYDEEESGIEIFLHRVVSQFSPLRRDLFMCEICLVWDDIKAWNTIYQQSQSKTVYIPPTCLDWDLDLQLTDREREARKEGAQNDRGRCGRHRLLLLWCASAALCDKV